jgi:hypothetical protein
MAGPSKATQIMHKAVKNGMRSHNSIGPIFMVVQAVDIQSLGEG